jgi:glycosyltransferase involved in cell wall biosynthesis
MDCKILHITPHLGGGIGTAYRGLLAYSPDEVKHQIVLLEEPHKPEVIRGLTPPAPVESPALIAPSALTLNKALEEADIVQINWWGHPLINQFLCNMPDIPVRLCGWFHINGSTYPFLRDKFFTPFDKVFFTSMLTLTEHYSRKTSLIYGMSPLDEFLKIQKKPHSNFRIGYIGTLDFCKLHPDYISYCAAAAKVADNIRFVMIGDDKNKNAILEQAKRYGIEDRFEFIGYSSDIKNELAQLDSLGYILNPYHFGTTENVILEAMAAGVPVITLKQNAEQFIIKDKNSGFLIKNQEEYADCIHSLYSNPQKYRNIASQAKRYIEKNFSAEENYGKIYGQYAELLQRRKRTKAGVFAEIIGNTPSTHLLYFADNKSRRLLTNLSEGSDPQKLEYVFRCESKGSIRQYAQYFPNDKKLADWVSILDRSILNRHE